MESRFYIGQDVVCIRSHSEGRVKEGEVFVIRGLMASPCKCGVLVLDVGINSNGNERYKCVYCGDIVKKHPNVFWFGNALFKPLDELADISELTEVLEKPIFSI